MARRSDARRAVHVYADVVRPRVGGRGTAFAGVHPHANPDGRTVRKRGFREAALRRGRRAHGVDGNGKDHEERIALHADLESTIFEGVAEDARVRLEDILIAVGAELGLKLGRALDVREKEREGAGRQPSPLAHPSLILRFRAFAKMEATL